MTRSYIVGYADQISVAPGETIRFMIGCEGTSSFDANVVRTLCGDLNPAGPGFKERQIESGVTGSYPARRQLCRAGSFVTIPHSPVVTELDSFTVQALIWPTTPDKGRQGLLTRWREDRRAGFALVVDEGGGIALELGDGQDGCQRVSTGKPLTNRTWYFVAASYNAATGGVLVVQDPICRTAGGEKPVTIHCRVEPKRFGGSAAPFVMAAWTESWESECPVTGGHFNGKIERPRLANRALDRLEMEQLNTDTIPDSLMSATVGFWDFSQDISSPAVHDLSANRLTGKTFNLPARAMAGSNWQAESTDWHKTPEHYGAIHFHDDDIYDAGWDPDIELTVPADWPSGLYACCVSTGSHADRIPFVVRPPRGRATARIAYLAPTATWMAYANLNPVPFDIAELLSGRLIVLHEANLLIDEHPEWGGSLYDVHSDGSGVCYSSRFRPILNMRPGYISSFGNEGSSLREFNAETHIIDWLETTGISYDTITDEDLHEEGLELLARYDTVVMGSHAEYFSTDMWDAVKAYTDRGGRLMVLGGNAFYWRIAYHPVLPGVIEVRRSGPAIRTWETAPGEDFQSFDGRRGGLWRALGRAPQSICGVGFVAEGFDRGAYYRRTASSLDPRVSFIFDGVGDGELIGDFGLQGGGAAGVEIDRADPQLGTPPHAIVLASSEGHTEAYRLVNEEISIMVPNVTGPSNPRIGADLVFFETVGGGAVFATGSIGWAGALSHNGYDNNVSRVTGNVLKRFANPERFQIPDTIK